MTTARDTGHDDQSVPEARSGCPLPQTLENGMRKYNLQRCTQLGESFPYPTLNHLLPFEDILEICPVEAGGFLPNATCTCFSYALWNLEFC